METQQLYGFSEGRGLYDPCGEYNVGIGLISHVTAGVARVPARRGRIWVNRALKSEYYPST